MFIPLKCVCGLVTAHYSPEGSAVHTHPCDDLTLICVFMFCGMKINYTWLSHASFTQIETFCGKCNCNKTVEEMDTVIFHGTIICHAWI
jgi:hypothetical protein